ncbi:hypothetical protein EDD16DRAFT_1715953 [Pisolithus croceorrhizus]|nr:hypothetical protein EDD16DRAFT_1715953 [Pisolithus croceorrhizus]KAI6115746.1 hypothetical protein EV401DRAFT_2210761 [Pisolithus croceorrhizus]KAI6162611.1 hypothetical protein EDD17DRAFT_1873416 [Pisolithus thermaeus]
MSTSLHLSIVTSGTQPFLSPFPAGPVFIATYTAPTSGSTPANANLSTPDTVTYVNNFPTPSSLTSGKIAAGVLVPPFLIGLGVAYYFKVSRVKAKEKTQRFSQAIDGRMSTISSDWTSISAAGTSAPIRKSIAVPSGPRAPSAFSLGSIRSISSVVIEDETASERRSTSMDGCYSKYVTASPGPSYCRFWRTGIQGLVRRRRSSSLPCPTRQDADDLSPIQTEGAFSLTPEDITARISGETTGQARPSMGKVWPSLTMSVEMPLPPTPAHAAPTSPIGMIPMSASVMSPDDMLRAYAGRKVTSPPRGPIAFPAPAASYDSQGRRTLSEYRRADFP